MKKRLAGAETKLEKRVQQIINSSAPDYENGAEGYLKDVFYGGCESGVVSELTYYNDTLKFYKLYRSEINDLLKETLQETGFKNPSDLFGSKWETDDPLAQDTYNQNLLAWFAFEETARKLAWENGIEC